jgi:hypothetical protein
MGAPPTQWGNIDWFDHRRLHGGIGLVPPAEHADNSHRNDTAHATVAITALTWLP